MTAADALERIAAANLSDPATDDLTVPLAIENAELTAEIERLRALLRHADNVVIWEHTPARPGFQEEIEAALGIDRQK